MCLELLRRQDSPSPLPFNKETGAYHFPWPVLDTGYRSEHQNDHALRPEDLATSAKRDYTNDPQCTEGEDCPIEGLRLKV